MIFYPPDTQALVESYAGPLEIPLVPDDIARAVWQCKWRTYAATRIQRGVRRAIHSQRFGAARRITVQGPLQPAPRSSRAVLC